MPIYFRRISFSWSNLFASEFMFIKLPIITLFSLVSLKFLIFNEGCKDATLIGLLLACWFKQPFESPHLYLFYQDCHSINFFPEEFSVNLSAERNLYLLKNYLNSVLYRFLPDEHHPFTNSLWRILLIENHCLYIDLAILNLISELLWEKL